jgi:hypothetical protein
VFGDENFWCHMVVLEGRGVVGGGRLVRYFWTPAYIFGGTRFLQNGNEGIRLALDCIREHIADYRIRN